MASVFTKVIKKEEILSEFLYADCTGKISNLLEDFKKVELFSQIVEPARYSDGYSDIYSGIKSSKKTGISSKKT